jgi:hypothetical protein
MRRSDLLRLAQYGAHREVAEIEQRLDTLQRQFPDIFVSDERIVLLKAELRHSENGAAPKHATRNANISASWTPERRAKQARRMSAWMRRKHGPKKSKKKSKKTPQKLWKDIWLERLQKHGHEKVGESAKVLGTVSANLLTSSRGYLKDGTIKKLGGGHYGAKS